MFAALLAVLLPALSFVVHGRVGINLADEGYLWYGTLRVLEGEVPLRDFQSYDPLRYYWCAAGSLVLGRGVVALRTSVLIFEAIGLFFGLLAARRAVSSRWLLLPVGLLFVLWMFPRHKAFEVTATLTAVYLSMRLLEEPTARRLLVCGIFTGVMGFLGRNHGLYNVVIFLSALVLVSARMGRLRFGPGLLRFGAGMLIGYSPGLLMMALVPGFAKASIDRIFFYIKHGSNIPLPYPWPWALGFEAQPALLRISIALSFLLPLVVYPVGLGCALFTAQERWRSRALLVASSLVGVVYFHHVTVRSAPGHLAQCIHPFLLACLALPAAFRVLRPAAIRTALWTAGCVTMSLAALGTNPHLEPWRPGSEVEYVPYDLAGDRLRIRSTTAEFLRRVQSEVDERVPEDELVFLAPAYTTLYPILGKRCPVWDIYFLTANDAAAQQRLIRDLEKNGVDWAIIFNAPTDGRRDLLFQNTNPMAWQYLLDRFERVPPRRLPRGHLLLRRRGDAG